MLETLSSTDFSNHLNGTFYIYTDTAESVEAELIEVTELDPETGPGGQAGKRRSFSVIFRVSQGLYLPQRIYKVAHEKMGALELFLVPLGPDPAGMRFEAVFT